MTAKRATIGRTLGKTTFSDPTAEQGVTFTLKSGRKVTFKKQHIEADKLEDSTFVETSTNGRDQAGLTPESLLDIRRTIKVQQFFPAIGFVASNGKVNTLDGSRRRKAAILEHVGLDYLVADEEISADDAKQLARDIQTAKEHNLRELGLELMSLKDSGLNQKEIAQERGLSAAKVTRALQAASVPSEMLSVFPDYSLLSHNEYKQLLSIQEALQAKGVTLDDLITHVMVDKDSFSDELTNDEAKDELIKLYGKHSKLLLDKPKAIKTKVTELAQFKNKDQFARKKVKGRFTSFEFNRLDKETLQEIELAISEIIAKNA
ncbi:ParB family protein [Motilimonas eburnea]|uniref:ParB family protein n=1 Tax=Motilimonas eburnea TaxID=1737488 RepID=UPI001E628AE4|nr:ParB family protein [Motilimonas eburnea]MCE2571766.1 ParB/RepB/Spo0J family partition protein [Motilimonas eburnea]